MDQPTPDPSTTRMSSFAIYWAKVQPSVTAFVRASVLSPHDAEDVVQETVRYLVEHFDEYDPERPFVAWAIGIARYRVLDFRHRRARDQRALNDQTLRKLALSFAEVGDIEVDTRREALEFCLAQLPKKNWALVHHRYYEGMSVSGIAEQFGTKPNSVSVILRRVRIALSKCIEQRLSTGGEA